MCNCIIEIEKKTFDLVKDQKEGEYSEGKILQSHFPIVNNKFKSRATHSEFEFTFAPKKKDGTIGKAKKQTVNVDHSFCPFCGEKH